jgi:hypothetical protein
MGRTFSEYEVMQRLKRAIKDAGSQTIFAYRHNIARSILSDTVNGRRNLSKPVLKALGLERRVVVRYKEII